MAADKEKTIREIIKDEYKKCYADPVHFLKKYCYIQHPQKGKILFHLYPFQEQTLQSLISEDYNIILKSRQLGISTLTAGYALWLMNFHEDKNVLVIATTQDVAKNLVTKVREMHKALPSWLKQESEEDNKLSLRYKNGSQIKAVSSTASAGRSVAASLLIFDEVAFCEKADDIWTSAQQTLATGGSAILLSTPNGTGNIFHKLWVQAEAGENRFKTTKLPWYVHPERNENWRKEQDELLGPRMAAQECDAVFENSGAGIVDPAIIMWYETTRIKEPLEKRGFDSNFWVWDVADYSRNYIVSADVARGDGSDFSTFHVLEIESMTQVAEYRGQVDTKTFGNMLVSVATEYNDALLVIENSNIGWAAIQAVIDRGYSNLYYSSKETIVLTDPSMHLRKSIDLRNQSDMVAGFTTSTRTRPMIIAKMELYLREKSPIVYSKRLLEELKVFVWKGNKAEAQQGYNDDLVLAFCIGLWVRDTALQLRQLGIDLNKRALDNISATGHGAYSSNSFTNNPYTMQIKNEQYDLTWLIR